MRKIVLQLAISLDGLIEGPNGEFDWCFTDGDYGMTEFLNRIDAILIGRKSFELAQSLGGSTPDFPEIKEYVFSNTLSHLEGNRELVRGDIETRVKEIKQQPGKDIWLYGGASLTTQLINLNLVDEIMLAVHPILLGAGKPLFQDIAQRKMLRLIESKPYPSGLVMLSYATR